MAGSSYLLDTVIVVAYFNRDQAVMQQLTGPHFFIPSIVVGELFFGAYHSGRVTDNVKQIQDFVAHNTILPCDEITGDYYGQIKRQLRAKGRPIPENDIWIAAAAVQHRLPLVTRDAHFLAVDGLALVTW